MTIKRYNAGIQRAKGFLEMAAGLFDGSLSSESWRAAEGVLQTDCRLGNAVRLSLLGKTKNPKTGISLSFATGGFREIQAAGGHIQIVQSRVQQGELVAVAAGTLSLTANGKLDGELQMTVAGIEKAIPALGIDKMLEQGVPQATLDRVAPGVKTQDINNLFNALDRAIPGLGKVVKQNANVGVAAGINALGKEAELEGKKARAFPLRFVDGAVFFGPLKVGDVPPLF